MSTTTVTEAAQAVAAKLALRPAAEDESKKQAEQQEKGTKKEEYKYAHLMPVFSQDRYPPLTPFEHIDPGHRALSHENPRAFLDGATDIDEITPHLGTEVTGVNLAELDSTGRDQLALEVSHTSRNNSPDSTCRRRLMSF